jgi:hypothetical protein
VVTLPLRAGPALAPVPKELPSIKLAAATLLYSTIAIAQDVTPVCKVTVTVFIPAGDDTIFVATYVYKFETVVNGLFLIKA